MGVALDGGELSKTNSPGRLARNGRLSSAVLGRFGRVADLRRSFRSIVAVKEVDRPAFEVLAEYERFNQKYNMSIVGRPTWDPPVQKMTKQAEDNVRSLAERKVSGYTLIDRSLAGSALALAHSFNTVVSYPNSGFLSWSPLRKPTYEAIGADRIRDLDEIDMANLIKKVAFLSGASLVGVTLLDRRWVYSRWHDNRSSPPRNPRIVFSDESGFEGYLRPSQLEDGTQIIPREMKYAVALGFEMDYKSIRTAPTAIADAAVWHGYRKVIQTVALLAEFIRGLGYSAIPSVNDTALSIPLAISAGLGEDGRNGLLLTPDHGPRLRLGKVITDLPLAIDRPIDFGVHGFCEQCNKCARACPVNALPSGDRTSGVEKNDVGAPTISESVGALRWIRNGERCRSYLAALGTDCGICIRVCPWNKPPGFMHAIGKWLAVNGGSSARRMLVALDRLLGYGNQMNPSEWWNS